MVRPLKAGPAGDLAAGGDPVAGQSEPLARRFSACAVAGAAVAAMMPPGRRAAAHRGARTTRSMTVIRNAQLAGLERESSAIRQHQAPTGS